MDQKKHQSGMENSVSTAIRVEGREVLDLQKHTGKDHVAKVSKESEAKRIKIGSLVKMIHPDTNPLGIVLSYEDDYHVFVHWMDEYFFPIHVQDIEVVSEPPNKGEK